MNRNSFSAVYKLLCPGIIAWAFVLHVHAACPTGQQVWDNLLSIEQSDLSGNEKMQKVLALQQQYIQCKLPKDSVYARILHRLGVLSFVANNMDAAIKYTHQSTQINRTGAKDASPRLVVNSYDNLGLYYKNLLFYREALQYFDSSLYFGNRVTGQERFVLQSRLMRSNIFFRTGDFQKSIDEATQGLFTARTVKDSFKIAQFLNERAQSMISTGLYDAAKTDLTEAIHILTIVPDLQDVLADSYRLMGTLHEFTNDVQRAFLFYTKAIEQRKIVNSLPELTKDLMETASFLSLKMNAPNEAMEYYNQALKLAMEEGDVTLKTQVLNNIGFLYRDKKNDVTGSLGYFQKGLTTYVQGFADTNVMVNPSVKQLQKIADKQLLFILLDNKAEALLKIYQQTKQKSYLQKANETFVLGDMVIDEMRYSQNTEPTKLYWRNKTRNFYSRAVTAAVENNDADAVLFFMEKSRSVLLNDKLNELGAFAYLPPVEAEQEQRLRINILGLQQQLNSISDTAKAYAGLQQQFFSAREGFEKFIQSLEQKFPAYHQYKYGGIGFSIRQVQDYVKKQNAAFISYYETDSLVYAVKISDTEKKIFVIRFPQLRSTADQFLQLCSNRQELNRNYNNYLQLSYYLYQQLFQPLAVQRKRVILSPDQVFLPFDAFTKDQNGSQFLLYDHVFSYTYSASYLIRSAKMKQSGSKQFLGVAPETYAADLQLADLNGSVQSLQKIRTNYSGAEVLSQTNATRKKFLSIAGNYSVLHVFAHAVADSIRNEPKLYMQDSAISLSELQFIQKPAVQLVFLSACETNTGKQQRGEGVYSLARGFAAAGIPATIATLWKADNEAMYSISETFHQLLRKGAAKDDALQQARIAFIKKGYKENQLPFYWASSVLLGNTEPVQISTGYITYLFTISAFLLALAGYYFWKKRKAAKEQPFKGTMLHREV